MKFTETQYPCVCGLVTSGLFYIIDRSTEKKLRKEVRGHSDPF